MAGRKIVVQLEYNYDVGALLKNMDKLMKNTRKPDLVYVKLSSAWFPKRVFDLPKELVEFAGIHPNVKFVWDENKPVLSEFEYATIDILGKTPITRNFIQRNLPIKHEVRNSKSRIVVTLTSWKKRIGNCVKVVQSILDNSMKPDLVFLNLSVEEFPKGEDDLPSNLVQLSVNNPEFRINWVEGPNTKAMKKVFPILGYLDDEDIIIWTDDDILFSKDLIQSRLWDAIKEGGFYPVFGTNNNKSIRSSFFGLPERWLCSTAVSMCKKKMLNGYEIFKDQLVNLVRDDQLYSYLIFLNGYRAKFCSEYAIWNKQSKSDLPWYNPIFGMKERIAQSNYNNLNAREDKIIMKIFNECDESIFDTHYLGRIRKQNTKKRIAVYTYCTNNQVGKQYQDIKYADDNIDYFMFVDDRKTGECSRNGWTCINITPKDGYSVNDMNKWYKWHPQLVIPNYEQYDYIMYVDSKVEIMENPNVIIQSIADNIPLGVCCHIYNYRAPSAMDNATCLYKHIDYLINFPAGIPEKLIEWKNKLRIMQFPENQKVAETAVVITDMHNPHGIELESSIFDMYKSAGTHRDQVVIPVVIRDKGHAMGQFCTLGYYLTYEDEIGTSFFRNNFKFDINTRNKRRQNTK